jgi:NADPH2:quinone reductase
MQVIQATRFGGPEVLAAVEAPSPVAGAGQVAIDVAVADVLFVDTLVRSGRAAEHFPARPPYVPGNGVAGVVSGAGEGVDPGWVGRRVVAHTAGPGGFGGYAEQTLADLEYVSDVPDGLELTDAAALLHDGKTALALQASHPIAAGEWVLVVGAAGGMGALLVQLVRAAGGRVVAAARGGRKLELARELGAEVVADYSEPDWPVRVREATGGAGPGLVLDGLGGQIGRAAFEIVAPGGRFSGHGAAGGGFAAIDPALAASRRVTVCGLEQLQVPPAERTRLTERALAEAAAGRLRPVIGQTFPLEQAADAHAAIEARSVIGKTLLLTG